MKFKSEYRPIGPASAETQKLARGELELWFTHFGSGRFLMDVPTRSFFSDKEVLRQALAVREKLKKSLQSDIQKLGMVPIGHQWIVSGNQLAGTWHYDPYNPNARREICCCFGGGTEIYRGNDAFDGFIPSSSIVAADSGMFYELLPTDYHRSSSSSDAHGIRLFTRTVVPPR